MSSVVRTSVCDWSDTSTASALVTHPEHARQSVSEIEAGGGGCDAAALSSVVTSYGFCVCEYAVATVKDLCYIRYYLLASLVESLSALCMRHPAK